MSPTSPLQGGTLVLAQQRLAWADRRHAVLAENVANADTPRFRPRDVLPFAQHLAVMRGASSDVARTHPHHIGPSATAQAGVRTDRQVGETAPDGNAVSLDREAVRIAETDSAHALALGLHRAFLGMFRTVLGR
jgi:flagellar basal-body rod protein FlgB